MRDLRTLRACPECGEAVLIGNGYIVVHVQGKGWMRRKAQAQNSGYHLKCAINVINRRNRRDERQQVFRWA